MMIIFCNLLGLINLTLIMIMITIIVVNIYNVKNEILFQITKSPSKYSDLVRVLKAMNLLMLFSFECVVFCVY